MAPERSRDRRERRTAPYHRRRSSHRQNQYNDRNDRSLPREYFPRYHSTPSTQSDLSRPSANPFSSGRAGETALDDEDLGDAGQSSEQSTQTPRFPASNLPNLVVVERATVLYSAAPFFPEPKLSVLDISFGKTVKTNFCARIEGPHGIWVGKFTHGELGGQLAELVMRTGNSKSYCAQIYPDGSSGVTTRHLDGSTFTFRPDGTSATIMWPDIPGNPEADVDLKELVEMIRGCWNV